MSPWSSNGVVQVIPTNQLYFWDNHDEGVNSMSAEQSNATDSAATNSPTKSTSAATQNRQEEGRQESTREICKEEDPTSH